ncbi:MAG: hypothetical protein AB3N11_03440 [Arenibacterium sp.]
MVDQAEPAGAEHALRVRPNERRVVRVFALEVPPEQIRFMRDESGALADMLGLTSVDLDHVDLIRLSDLDELGLLGYLVEGCDVKEDEVEPSTEILDALQGHVLVVLSRAFGGKAAMLAPKPGLRLVATFGQAATDWSDSETLDIESARPSTSPRVSPRQSRAEARRIGGTIFAVFMVAIALILWAVLT